MKMKIMLWIITFFRAQPAVLIVEGEDVPGCKLNLRWCGALHDEVDAGPAGGTEQMEPFFFFFFSHLFIPDILRPKARVQRHSGSNRVKPFPPSAPAQPFGKAGIWHWSHICQKLKLVWLLKHTSASTWSRSWLSINEPAVEFNAEK